MCQIISCRLYTQVIDDNFLLCIIKGYTVILLLPCIDILMFNPFVMVAIYLNIKTFASDIYYVLFTLIKNNFSYRFDVILLFYDMHNKYLTTILIYTNYVHINIFN